MSDPRDIAALEDELAVTRQALTDLTVDDPLTDDDDGSFCFFCAASLRWFAGEPSLEHSVTCPWAAARVVLGEDTTA